MQGQLHDQSPVLLRRHGALEKLLPADDALILARQTLTTVQDGKVFVAVVQMVPQPQAVGGVLAAFSQDTIVAAAEVDLCRSANGDAEQRPADVAQPVRGNTQGPQVVSVDASLKDAYRDEAAELAIADGVDLARVGIVQGRDRQDACREDGALDAECLQGLPASANVVDEVVEPADV